MAEGWMPGAAWWVEGGQGVVSRGCVGSAVLLPAAEPVSESTLYDLASLTKALATAPLLVLFEQDRLLDLDAPVATYLPELQCAPVASASLLSLAVHAGGLPAWRPLYLEGGGLQGYIAQIARLPLTAGLAQTLYSDLGYILLGAVLERVAGLGLDRLFEMHIAQPLGLSCLGYTRGEPFADAAATEAGNQHERSMAAAGAAYPWRTHVLRGVPHDVNAHGLGGIAGHAGLFGTVTDVARLAREVLAPALLPLGEVARGRLLRTAGGSRCRTVGMVTASGSSAARGILRDDAPGHTGFTGTSMWLDPAARTVFVLLSNRVHPRVTERDFQLVRRGFHRLASSLSRQAARN